MSAFANESDDVPVSLGRLSPRMTTILSYPDNIDPGTGDERVTAPSPLNDVEIGILITVVDAGHLIGAYEIVKGLRGIDGECMFTESRVYRTVRDLAKRGYLEPHEEERARGEHVRYFRTAKAVEAI